MEYDPNPVITAWREQNKQDKLDAERYRRLCTLLESGTWFAGFMDPGTGTYEPAKNQIDDGAGLTRWMDDPETIAFIEKYRAKYGT